MKKKRTIIIGCVITVMVFAWLGMSMVFSTVLNNYLSTLTKVKREGDSEINYYSADNNQEYGLAGSDVLVLPMRFERQMFRVGVYVGEQLDGTGNYVFQIEDEFGNILGKTVAGIEKMQPDSFVYINIEYGVISLAQTYYLKVFAEEPDSQGTPLNMVVSNAADFRTSPFTINGVVGEKTVILDYRYSAVNSGILFRIDLLMIAVAMLYWGAYAFGRIPAEKKDQVRRTVRNIPWYKVIIYAAGILVVLDVSIFLFPRKCYMGVAGNGRFDHDNERVIPLHDDIVEQCIRAEDGTIDSFAVMFATYDKKLQGGTVYAELWDKSQNQLVYSSNVNSGEITDNEYYYFNLSAPVSLGEGDFVIKLHAEFPDPDDTVAVYLNDRHSELMYARKNDTALDGSIVFKLCRSVKQQRTDLFVIVSCVLLAVLLVYVLKFANFHRVILKYAFSLAIITLLLYPIVNALLTYHEVSMNTVTAVLKKRSEFSGFRQYDGDELLDAFSTEQKYDYKGSVYEYREYLDIPYNGIITSISLDVDGSKILNKGYDIQIYWDSGDGFNGRQMYSYKYIHGEGVFSGGDKITFQVPCSDIVDKLRISVGEIFDYTYSERLVPIQTVCINSREDGQRDSAAKLLKNMIVALSIVFSGVIICIWKYKEVDERLSFYCTEKKITVSVRFAAIALVYGLLMCFLIPTGQAPDESSHVRMLYSDLGDSGMKDKIDNALADNGTLDVMRMPGQGVDVFKYISASQNKLEKYDFHRTFPSVKLIRRPGQAIGVTIGQILHMPAYWILQCGELGALAVYIAVGMVTLRLMPCKKDLMMAIMLLPTAIQQAGSISYDSFTNAAAFLMIAYIMYLKMEAEKVSWVQIAKLSGLAVLLLICKVVYVLLFGLVFIIPIEKLELKAGRFTINSNWLKAHKIIVIIFVVIGFPVCIASAIGFLSILGYGNVLDTILEIITSFSQFVRLLVKSVLIHYEAWVNGAICTLGWFDVPVNKIFIWMIFMSLFIFTFMEQGQKKQNMCFKQTEYKLCMADGIICYSVFALTFAAINMSQVSHGFLMYRVNGGTPFVMAIRLLPRIEGVQGRYFLPILPLLFIPLPMKKGFLKFIPGRLYKICYYAVTVIYPVSWLLARYWGVAGAGFVFKG